MTAATPPSALTSPRCWQRTTTWLSLWTTARMTASTPQKADFTFYGGIYRDVTLLVVNKNHIALNYLGGCGVQITPDRQRQQGRHCRQILGRG